jgi:hypothetical protein
MNLIAPRPPRLRRTFGMIIFVLLGLSADIIFQPVQANACPETHAAQIIPMYDVASPANWTRTCSQVSTARGGSLVIADPVSGPGSAPNPAWAAVIHDCYRYDRASVIGYVSTNYGRAGDAGLASLKQQIDDWYAFYPGDIAGIFLDGISDTIPGTTISNLPFYRTLISYVHAHEGRDTFLVLNFGQNPGSGWMFEADDAEDADLVVTFEGSYDTPGLNPYTQWEQAAWEWNYASSNFGMIVYGAPDLTGSPQPATACTRLKSMNVGYVYVGTAFSEVAPYFESVPTLC